MVPSKDLRPALRRQLADLEAKADRLVQEREAVAAERRAVALDAPERLPELRERGRALEDELIDVSTAVEMVGQRIAELDQEVRKARQRTASLEAEAWAEKRLEIARQLDVLFAQAGELHRQFDDAGVRWAALRREAGEQAPSGPKLAATHGIQGALLRAAPILADALQVARAPQASRVSLAEQTSRLCGTERGRDAA